VVRFCFVLFFICLFVFLFLVGVGFKEKGTRLAFVFHLLAGKY